MPPASIAIISELKANFEDTKITAKKVKRELKRFI
jgi:hypothetical protein